MSPKGALNLTAILLIVCNLLFVFSVWVSANWIERVQALEPRVIILETALDGKMDAIEKRLERIEKKLDTP